MSSPVRPLRLPALLSFAALFSFLIASCGDLGEDLPTAAPTGAESAEMLQQVPAGPQDFGPAIRAAERHTPALMRTPGVVGTGVGLNAAGRPSVKVFLVHDQVPGVPAQLDQVPVAREVTGMFTLRADPTSRARPAPMGFSVGHPDITAGTLGARVTDGENVYILSNNHILANSNNASIGDAALQPGPFDGGSDPADRIGLLHDFQPISFSSNNEMDAAIAIVDPNDVMGTTGTDGYGAPSTTVVNASVGMGVQKYGRTTGHTTGTVEETNVTVSVCFVARGPFCQQAATFVGQISITDGSFSAGGDSGSLIVTQDGNNPVGLLFAGSDTRTIANQIGVVLDRFGVTIDPTVPGDDNGDPDPVGPTASFDHTCTELSCDFSSTSSAGDAAITSHAWDFGDGNTGTGESVSHTYAASGTYTVTLTVTDGDGLTDSTAESVTVQEAPDEGDITLSATAYKVRGLQKADLEWSGATSSDVNVLRGGVVIATTANDGFYTDNIDNRGGGSYTYQICEAGTQICSNTVTITF